MLIALVLACIAPDTSAQKGRAAPIFDMEQAAAPVTARLLDAAADADFSLPKDAARGVTHADGRFALEGEWSRREAPLAGLTGWTHPLPFQNDMPRPNYAPWGAKLFVDGTEWPFVNQIEDVAESRRGWLVERDRVVLLSSTAPTGKVTLEAPSLGHALTNRVYDGSDAATWARTEVTHGKTTRPALHLPAGGSVTFRLPLPAGAVLDAGLGPLPHPLAAVADEPTVDVVLMLDDKEVAREHVAPDDTWRTWSVDLDAQAAAHTLTLRVEGNAGGHAVVTAPVIRAPVKKAPRRVVVVGIDTLRQDALGVHGYARPTSPELDAWTQQAVVFDQARSPAPRTRPSFRTALTGKWPLAAATSPTLAERLRDEGFRTAGVVANVHLVPRFGFNAGFEHWEYENGARAEVQVDRGLAWLGAHQDEDSFLFLHLMDPHTWYNAPEPFAGKFQGGARRPADLPEVFDRWQVVSLMKRKAWSKAHETWTRNAYDEEVAYMSAQLGRFLTAVDALPGETLIVVHTDHGEEFWDHGGFEHNHTLYEELVRTVLWVRPPGGWAAGPHRVQAPVSLADIVPTVLDLVGASKRDGLDGTSLRPFVDAKAAPQAEALTRTLVDRPLQLGHLMFGTERWGVVSHGRTYILHTPTGREEVYDLARDPRQQKDRAASLGANELSQLRGALGAATGWPVVDALRVTFKTPPRTITFRAEAPLRDARVLDPEAERPIRANLEWGERPQVTTADVGNVIVNDEGRTVTFEPGPRARGHQIYLACAATCPTVVAETSAGKTTLQAGHVDIAGMGLEVRTGPLLLQPTAEEQLSAPSAEQLQALEALGYVDGD